jgi:aspartate/glutamate racemase
MKKIAIIHTSFVLVDIVTELFNKIIPEAELVHIVDDSVLSEILLEKKITKKVLRRMLSYFKAAEDTGADVIFNICSTVGEVADMARLMIDTPIVKIDERMAEEAVRKGTIIGVAATLQSTMDPTCRQIESKADKAGKKITIEKTLCPGAFDALIAGKKDEHDRIVTEYVKELADKVEIVVFAQYSMAKLLDSMESDLAKKILISPEMGVRQTREVLKL